MPTHEPPAFPTCAICGRTLLRGERSIEYLTAEREPVQVCPLCRAEAERLGWIRADSPQATTPQAPARRRRRLNLRLAERARELAQRAREAQAQRVPAPDASEPEEMPAPPPAPETPAQRIRHGVARFNDSEARRVVAGLTRSLGVPRAAIRELAAPNRVEVTVAWDLSWYRWEVGANGEGAPRQVAKGAEVDELAADDLSWNASVDEEGRLRWQEGS